MWIIVLDDVLAPGKKSSYRAIKTCKLVQFFPFSRDYVSYKLLTYKEYALIKAYTKNLLRTRIIFRKLLEFSTRSRGEPAVYSELHACRWRTDVRPNVHRPQS